MMLTPLESENLTGLDGIRHGFFLRDGGVSTGLYGSLNCGLGSADSREAVLENRRRVSRTLAGASGPFAGQVVTLHQIHSATALTIAQPFEAGALPRADALVTRTPGLVIGALAADCAPVLFADPTTSTVAAAHAGWRGAFGGIIEATLDAMVSAGADRTRIRAAVGPSIGQASYEVGTEFEEQFLAADPANERWFTRPEAGAKPRFDLPGYVAARLRAAGIRDVSGLGLCTYLATDRCFSYRRATHQGETDYGRQISAIAVS